VQAAPSRRGPVGQRHRMGAGSFRIQNNSLKLPDNIMQMSATVAHASPEEAHRCRPKRPMRFFAPQAIYCRAGRRLRNNALILAAPEALSSIQSSFEFSRSRWQLIRPRSSSTAAQRATVVFGATI